MYQIILNISLCVSVTLNFILFILLMKAKIKLNPQKSRKKKRKNDGFIDLTLGNSPVMNIEGAINPTSTVILNKKEQEKTGEKLTENASSFLTKEDKKARDKAKRLHKQSIAISDFVKKNKLQGLSDYIQMRCVTRAIYGTDNKVLMWYHALPLMNEERYPLEPSNWMLSKSDKKKVQGIFKTFDKYVSMIQRYYEESGSLNTLDNIFIVLPPWVVFPAYSNQSTNWRSGNGKTYYDIFRKFVVSMTEAQKKQYSAIFVAPDYIDVNFLKLNEDEEDWFTQMTSEEKTYWQGKPYLYEKRSKEDNIRNYYEKKTMNNYGQQNIAR